MASSIRVIGDEPDETTDQNPPTQAGSSSPAPKKSAFKLGALLEEQDEKKIAETIVKLVQDQEPARKRRRIWAECSRLWMKGIRGVRVRPVNQDLREMELYVPLGALDVPPVMDRTEELVERLIAHLLADKPIPDAEPADDTDEEREGAEFTTRLLTVEGSESGFNLVQVIRRAERKAALWGSGFVYVCVDPQGNGWAPMEIRAHPMAQTVEDATTDPNTGKEVASDDALTTRYVRADNSLTDDPNEAQPQWKPRLNVEVLTPEQVVLLPAQCSGINDATGVILIRFPSVGELRSKFPDFAKLSDDDIREMIAWRPDAVKKADTNAANIRQKSPTDTEKVPDTATLCTLSLYYRSHGAYPKGAYIVVAGGKKVLWKKPWSGMVEDPKGRLVEEMLDLPVAQFRQLDDDVDDDHMGTGIARKLGFIDEIRGTIVTAWLEHLDRIMHPIPFLPMGSVVRPEQMQIRDGTPVYFNPQGKPEYEQIDPFPADAKEFFDRTTSAGDSASMLAETAQATESPNSKSGVAKAIVVQQAERNTASVRDNAGDGTERTWRIAAQHYRAFYTVPQQIKYEGDDGAWRRKEWSRIDLRSTKNIRIAAGSFTQMTPEQKEAMADKLVMMVDPATGQRVIDFDEYKRLITSNARPKAGIRDNPHVLRVKRQISKWFDGPPADFAEQSQAYEAQQMQAQQQAQAAAMDAQATGMQPPAPPEMGPAPYDPFDVRPVDDVQDVARLRYLELAREMAGSRYAQQPPEWQALFNAAFDRARQAAGISTLAEQQQAQAEAAAQQQAAMQQDADAQRQAQAEQGDADRSAKASEADASRAHDIAKQEVSGAQKLNELALQGAQRANELQMQAGQMMNG